MMAMEILVKGIFQYGEPGVFMSFEEREQDLVENFASLGFDLKQLIRDKKLTIDFVYIEPSEVSETGEYDLEGIFVRLAYAIQQIGAKRVALDTIEALFAGLSSESILRAELRRLFRWLKNQNLTGIVTGERGEKRLTRYGLEEYVADCVIALDNRVINEISTRRMRVIKYRGSAHGSNEYPFLITERGISVFPITSLKLEAKVTTERVSSGIPDLDRMLEGRGFFRGSSVLISGMAGVGKSSIAACYAAAACERGEKCLVFLFEESPAQVIRNMGSIGLDMQKYIDLGLLKFNATRTTMQGLEMHLVTILEQVDLFNPQHVIIDPISNFQPVGSVEEIKAMFTRIIDYLKNRNITAIFTDLLTAAPEISIGSAQVSSLADTWIMVRNRESGRERIRLINIIKSRGMNHSQEINQLVMADNGLSIISLSNV
jgi:circadian clock protein KaiC